MKCYQCKKNFEERFLDESHDVPCYLFEGNRKGRKNQADKFGRHWLCRKCHKNYESKLREFLKLKAGDFASWYFKEGVINDGFLY